MLVKMKLTVCVVAASILFLTACASTDSSAPAVTHDGLTLVPRYKIQRGLS